MFGATYQSGANPFGANPFGAFRPTITGPQGARGPASQLASTRPGHVRGPRDRARSDSSPDIARCQLPNRSLTVTLCFTGANEAEEARAAESNLVTTPARPGRARSALSLVQPGAALLRFPKS